MGGTEKKYFSHCRSITFSQVHTAVKIDLRTRLSGEPLLQTKPWHNLRNQGPGQFENDMTLLSLPRRSLVLALDEEEDDDKEEESTSWRAWLSTSDACPSCGSCENEAPAAAS